MEKQKMKPYLALWIGVIAVSTSAIFVKLSTAEAGVIAFYRLFFTVILMSPLFWLKFRQELKKITKRDWVFSIVSGIFLAFHFILWFESLNYTSVASSTVLVTLQPLFAFIGTYIFFNEKLSVKAILAGGLALCGSVLISWGDFRISGLALWGDILALMACALITAYLLFGQNVRRRLSLVTYTYVVYSISSLVLFIYVWIKGENYISLPKIEWLYFVLLALIPTLLGHTLFNWSLKWISTSTISMVILIEPIGASLLAYLLLGEVVTPYQVIGGGIIMIGIFLFLLNENKMKRKNASSA
ncbi:DMT family transporter [Bacillus sp. 2205SS5-2]|uniref:DMT family transporter n=1 Tax=Bacillus sp. 2205SS5-2 TaxID=3109031 RepID=UPI0030058B82